MENEVMNVAEEVTEVATTAAVKQPVAWKGLAVVGGAGVLVGIGIKAIYDKFAAPKIKAAKAKKQAKQEPETEEAYEDADFEEV